MRKYGIPLVHAVDNKTWKYENYLSTIVQDDAVEFVKRSGDADMFVLSWPYMNPLAAMIWKNMKPGQYLLYIGEGQGDCTANYEFFELTQDHRVDDEKFRKVEDSFVRFAMLSDGPELYLKK